ncbi:MAG: hypothetical protein U0905_22880 [Pirellulales bacterium]
MRVLDFISTRRGQVAAPILAAGVFMVVGVLVLVFIGRDKSKILNSPMPDLELVSLLVDNEPSIGAPPGCIAGESHCLSFLGYLVWALSANTQSSMR